MMNVNEGEKMTLETTFPTLISTLLPTGKLNSGVRFVLLAAVGSIVIAISSKIQIPFYGNNRVMLDFVTYLIICVAS